MVRRFCLVFALVLVPTLAFSVPKETMVFKATKSVAANEKVIAAGIEKATEGMSFITKPIAKSRLSKSNVAFASIGFKFPDNKVSIQHDARKPVDSPTDGKKVQWTREDGESFMVSQKVSDTKIVQVFHAEDGDKTLEYVFSEDFQTMKVHVQLDSPKLPSPLKYTLEYSR